MRTPSSLDPATRDLGIRALQRLSAGSTSSIERVGDNFQIRGPETLSPALSPRPTARGSRSRPVQGPVGAADRAVSVDVGCATLRDGRQRPAATISPILPGSAFTNSQPAQADRTSAGQFPAGKRPNGPSAQPLVVTAHLAGTARSCSRRSASRGHLTKPEVTKSRVCRIGGRPTVGRRPERR
jgi:hypothetical protein